MQMNNLHVYSIAHNEAPLVPYFLACYRDHWQADKITVFCHDCDDGTAETLHAAGVETLDIWHGQPLDDEKLRQLASTCWRGQPEKWAVFVGFDELIYHPAPAAFLACLESSGVNAAIADGYMMIGDAFPAWDGRQMWEHITHGVPDHHSSKPALFRADIDLTYGMGCHEAYIKGLGVISAAEYKLLHYRYFGADWYRARNARHFARMSALNKTNGSGYHTAPDNTERAIREIESARREQVIYG